MPSGGKTFDKRMERISRKQAKMRSGVVYVTQKDGLIVGRPRIYQPRFPWRGIVLLIGAAAIFKGAIFAHLGAEIYSERLASFNGGTLIEEAGAWIMQPEPVTIAVAKGMTKLGL